MNAVTGRTFLNTIGLSKYQKISYNLYENYSDELISRKKTHKAVDKTLVGFVRFYLGVSSKTKRRNKRGRPVTVIVGVVK